MSVPCRDETVIPATSARTTGANDRRSSKNENDMQNVGRWSDRVKLLAWDGSGMVLVTKWLEEGRFTWPPIRDGVVALTATQLSMLIDGLNWTRVTPKVVKRPVAMM
jgi:transposase